MRFSVFIPNVSVLRCVAEDENGYVWWTHDYEKAKRKAYTRDGIVVDGDELTKRWNEVVDGTWTPSEVKR